jgi:hypothetical protein
MAATGHLCQEDRSLSGFSLTKQHPVLSFRVRPMLEKLAGDWGDACVLAAAAPLGDVATDIVNQAISLARRSPVASKSN